MYDIAKRLGWDQKNPEATPTPIPTSKSKSTPKPSNNSLRQAVERGRSAVGSAERRLQNARSIAFRAVVEDIIQDEWQRITYTGYGHELGDDCSLPVLIEEAASKGETEISAWHCSLEWGYYAEVALGRADDPDGDIDSAIDELEKEFDRYLRRGGLTASYDHSRGEIYAVHLSW